MSRLRVFHRLPTAAVLSTGIAAVDSPWKTLLDRPPVPTQHRPFQLRRRAPPERPGAQPSRTPVGALNGAMFRWRRRMAVRNAWLARTLAGGYLPSQVPGRN